MIAQTTQHNKVFDPAELWNDSSMDELLLMKLDPLPITRQMEEIAEHPELANPLIRAIRVKPMKRNAFSDYFASSS